MRSALDVAASTLASSARAWRGTLARPAARRPERLCELELPFVLRSTGKAQAADLGPPWMRRALFPGAPVRGRNRERLFARTGRLQVPYLGDPNTGEALFESDAILAYLEARYGAP